MHLAAVVPQIGDRSGDAAVGTQQLDQIADTQAGGVFATAQHERIG